MTAPTDEELNTAASAIERVLDILRMELQSNPELAYRMIKALGAPVVFEGKHAAKLINPLELVAGHSEVEARAQLIALSAPDLKTLAKLSGLATAVDVKSKSHEELVEMIYQRASDKVAERRSAL